VSTHVVMNFLDGMGWVWSSQVDLHFVCLLAWLGFRTSLVGIHFVSSLTWEGIVQNEMRFILGPRWHGMGLVNTCGDGVSVCAGMGGFGKHMLRYILCSRWHIRGLVNTC